MQKPKVVALAAVLAGVIGSAGSVSAQEAVTPMRAKVRQWEIAMTQKALGDSAGTAAIRPQVVGGIQSPAGAWPFQVALLDARVANNFNAQFCGGALVNKTYVVTAAHCVYGSTAAKIHVLTGTQSLTSGGTRHTVASIKIHPSYRNATTDYDIAVIKLNSPAVVSRYSTLLTPQAEATLAAVGKPATAIGWGNVSATGSSYPALLRQVVVPLVSRTDCNDSNSYSGAITARMICAGLTAGGKDSCDGDSGGPLMVKDASGKYTLQAGIVSWGTGCAKRNLFGVYSRVAVLQAWAANIIATGSAQPVHVVGYPN